VLTFDFRSISCSLTTSGEGSAFDIVGIQLQQAIEVLVASPSTTAFQFITPVSSLDFVRMNLKKDGPFSEIFENDDGAPEKAE